MSMGLQYYPQSVQEVPRGLTAPRPRYVLYSLIVLVSLFLFLALYAGLVAGAGWLVYTAVVYPLGSINRITLFLKAGAIACSGMLFLFLLKGLFKRQEWDDSQYVEVTEAEQPGLYAFVRRLCREVGAPFPHRIYFTPEVGAHVFYDTSLLNLFLPVRKNLAIGMGLMNVVTMNEFKAVLAHEFGHFSQSGMAIGQYAFVANRIVHDLVFGRDRWDDWLDEWKERDFRLAIFAWVISAVVWLLRAVLKAVYLLMNLAQFAMLRQMELQADLVAVRVTGSDAIVNALARHRFADEALAVSIANLTSAALQGRFSRDLYYHHERAMARLRQQHRNPRLGLPPALPADPTQKVQVFPPAETSSIWATHPSLHEREQNAKRHYLRSEDNGISPWTLLKEPELARAEVTAQVYRIQAGVTGPIDFVEPESVEKQFPGLQEQRFDERYHGLYDARFVEPGDLAALVTQARTRPWPGARLAQVFDRVYGGGMTEWLQAHAKRQEEASFLAAVEAGFVRVPRKGFEFRGSRRRPQDVGSLLRMVQSELESDRETLSALDRDVFLAHVQMALAVAPAAAQELYMRYEFHRQMQAVLRQVQKAQARVRSVVRAASAAGKLSEADVRAVNGELRQARTVLVSAPASLAGLALPPGVQATGGIPLDRYLRPGNPVSDLYSETVLAGGEWVQSLVGQLEGVQERSRGVHYESLGAILSLQERIAAAWRTAGAVSGAAR
jgi:Zn-dependent protease with chaperone function